MQRDYEAMFLVRPDLAKEKKESIFAQFEESITKLGGKIISQEVWQEKAKFTFIIKKFDEGLYYLIKFSIDPSAILELKELYRLNEDILRVMITSLQSEQKV